MGDVGAMAGQPDVEAQLPEGPGARSKFQTAGYVVLPLVLLGALLVVNHGGSTVTTESGAVVGTLFQQLQDDPVAITPDAAPNLNVASDAVKDAIVKGHELITDAKLLAAKQMRETKERAEFQMNEYLTQVYQNRLNIAKEDALATMNHATQLAHSYDDTASKGISEFNAKTMAEKDALDKSIHQARDSAGKIVQNGENAAADIIKKGQEAATPTA